MAKSLAWLKTSARSIASGTYAVSCATVLDEATGELVERYSAWFGPDLLAQPRETSKPAQLLGVCDTAQAAKDLCEGHAQEISAAR